MATEITITLSTDPEIETPEESERRTGSAEGYAEAVRKVQETAEGRWGWCQAVVTATIGDKVGESYLGNCSYKNAEDFLDSGYFFDMVREALAAAKRA